MAEASGAAYPRAYPRLPHLGAVVTYPRVTWTTDLEGLMTSSDGAAAVPWRAWETRGQNLARGVRGEDIPEDPPWLKDKK